MGPEVPSLATIEEIAAETKTRPSFWYERSRRGAIPGQRRVGKFIRIDRDVFYAALRQQAQVSTPA